MYSNMDALSGFAVMLGTFSIFIFILVIAILVLYLAGLWKLFQKAGRKGWEAIIPFYNSWVLVEIAGLAWWYALLVILSSVISKGSLDYILSIGSIIAIFFAYYNISKKLHKNTGFAILMTIFPFIMIPMVGFSNNYQFDKNVPVSENGPVGQSNANYSSNNEANVNEIYSSSSNTNAKVEKHFCPHCGSPIDGDVKYCGNCGNEIK